MNERIAKCIELYRAGVKQSDIARELGMTRQGVHNALVAHCPDFVIVDRTNPNLETALHDFANGVKVKDIEKRYSISSATIYLYAKKNQIALKTASRDARIIELINSGHKPKDVAEILNCSAGAVRYAIRKHVDEIVPITSKAPEGKGCKVVRKDEQKRQRILELYSAGVSQSNIARELNISRQRVSILIKEIRG